MKVELNQWKTEDFVTVFNFFRDMAAALENPSLLMECRELLASECAAARERFGVISDAVQVPCAFRHDVARLR